jgi:hypothetical protein
MTRRYLHTPLRGNPWRMWDPPNCEPWQQRAACAGDQSESWFIPPRKLPPPELERLALLCRHCPVRRECFMAAVGERAYQVNRAGCWWTDQPDPTLWAGQYLRTGLLPAALFFASEEVE